MAIENDINLVTIGFCHENKSDNIRNIMMIYLREGVEAGIYGCACSILDSDILL